MHMSWFASYMANNCRWLYDLAEGITLTTSQVR